MRRVRTWHLCLGLLALTVAAYLPLWKNDFIDFDDESYITANPRVIQGLSWSGVGWAWASVDHHYWQPLSWLSLQLDAHFFSTRSPEGRTVLSPAAFHGQNLFWHACSALLLFGLLLRLTGARGPSLLVAALFALHPMRVESVAWAAERKDVLCVFFGLLTLWAYTRYLERPGWVRYLGVAAAFAASLMSKPLLITLPFVLLLLDYWPLRRLWPAPALPGASEGAAPVRVSLGRAVLEKVPLFLMAAAVAAVTVVSREQTGATVPLSALPLSARLANAVTAYGCYLSATFWPVGLAVLYPHPLENWALLPALAGGGALLALTVLSLWQARRWPWLAVGWLWFAGTLVPVIGLAQGGEQAWADRFTYWPHIGLFLAVVWVGRDVAARLRVPVSVSAAVAALAVGWLAVLTWQQLGHWRGTVSVWERALAVTEGNHRAHLNLGRYYFDRGQYDEAEAHVAAAVRLQPDAPEARHFLGGTLLALGRLEEAVAEMREALRRSPRHADAWHNVGTARLRQGNFPAAVRAFRKALEVRPDLPGTLAGLGLALWRSGQREEATRAFEAAVQRDPRDPHAWHGLGLVALARGDHPRAIRALGNAVRAGPQMVKAYGDLGLALGRYGAWGDAISCLIRAVRLQDQGEAFMGRLKGHVPPPEPIAQGVLLRCRLAFALHQAGDPRSAAEVYREALERDPLCPHKLTAQAWALATAPDESARDPRLAHELASQALQAAGDPPASALDALAAAQAALAKFDDAARTAQRALDRARASGETGLAQAIEHRLQLYRQGKPFADRRPGANPS
jgi:protein O-mannosyl-transferase